MCLTIGAVVRTILVTQRETRATTAHPKNRCPNLNGDSLVSQRNWKGSPTAVIQPPQTVGDSHVTVCFLE